MLFSNMNVEGQVRTCKEISINFTNGPSNITYL